MKKTKNQFRLEIKKRCPDLTNKEIEEYIESLDINEWYEDERMKFKLTNKRIKEKEEEKIKRVGPFIITWEGTELWEKWKSEK